MVIQEIISKMNSPEILPMNIFRSFIILAFMCKCGPTAERSWKSPWWQRTLEKADVSNAAFTSAYSSKSGLQHLQLLDITGKICSKEAVSLVGDDEIKKSLGNLDVLWVCDDLQVLRKQVDAITRPLVIIFDHGNWKKYSKTEEKQIFLLSPRARTPGITVQSASSQFLAMWWSNNSQKPFLGISKTGVVKGHQHHSGEAMLDTKGQPLLWGLTERLQRLPREV